MRGPASLASPPKPQAYGDKNHQAEARGSTTRCTSVTRDTPCNHGAPRGGTKGVAHLLCTQPLAASNAEAQALCSRGEQVWGRTQGACTREGQA